MSNSGCDVRRGRPGGAPVIALTPGEPAGIGPDIGLLAALRPLPAGIVAIADPALLRERARRLGLTLELRPYRADAPPGAHRPGTLTVLAVDRAAPTDCGQPSPANARYVLETLRRAVRGCLQGEFAALVTGPVHKAVVNEAGIPFTGHTEFLAGLTQTPQIVMMLATPGLRVALVTTHLPLREVIAAITPQRLEATLRITHESLRECFGITRPRLLVCGLNPHAGEAGHLGTEEVEVITPTVERLAREGLHLTGPLPADTAFIPGRLAEADAVVAMYHDQGLPVLKHMGFGRAVNITLGLPIVRTSVDHGTACELAGTGRADPESLIAAIETAVAMATHRERARRPGP